MNEDLGDLEQCQLPLMAYVLQSCAVRGGLGALALDCTEAVLGLTRMMETVWQAV